MSTVQAWERIGGTLDTWYWRSGVEYGERGGYLRQVVSAFPMSFAFTSRGVKPDEL